MSSRAVITFIVAFAPLLSACNASGDAASAIDGAMEQRDMSSSTSSRSLVFSVQPTTTKSGGIVAPPITVSVVDGDGKVVTSATDTITIAVGNNPSAATLAGTLSRAAVLGVATFGDLALDKGGLAYTLVASAPGASLATSAPFDASRVLSFATPTMLATNANVVSQAFTTGKFHAAGYDDFAATQGGADNVIVYLSSGTGAFNAGTTFATGTNPSAIAAADIDGDGKIDLVVQCAKEVDVLRGDGAGNFTSTPFTTGNASSNLAGIAVGAFNKSGKVDVVVADTFDNSIYLYSNTSTSGTPTLTATHVVGPAALGFTKGISAGDFNADGALDVAFGNFTSTGTVVVWLNANTGAAATSFAIGGASPLTMLGNNAALQTITAADFNGDGRADVFAPDDTPKSAGGIQNQGNVFLSKSSGFAAPTETNVGDDPFSAGHADFDQDGFVDVALASTFGLVFSATSPSDLEILLGKGDGTFQAAKPFATQAADNSARALAIGDFNGDGLPDAIIGSNPAWVFLNNSK